METAHNLMKAQYTQSGGVSYAHNYKAASASIIRAIISAHYPDIEYHINNNVSYCEGSSVDSKRWHYKLPRTEEPTSNVVLIVRDPVERFRSACAETFTTDVDALLAKIESGERYANPFWPTSRLLKGTVQLYRFESDLDDAATALGLTLPLPDIDGGNGEKPDLTPDQLTRVQSIYADDIALFESITEAGQVTTYVAPPAPVYVPQEITSRQLMQQLELQGDLDTLDTVIATQAKSVQIDWAKAASFKRSWPTLVAMVGYLAAEVDPKWTDEYVDQSFIDAVTNFPS